MQQIYDKINAHKYLNNEDIAHFISVFSNGEVKTEFSTDDKFDIYYMAISNSVVIDKNFRSQKLNSLINILDENLKAELNEENSTFLTDLYNLFLLQNLFHELEHANQIKLINKKMTFRTNLIKENYKFIELDFEMYNKNHDLYYHEYDATIMALIRTLNIINENCKNLNQKSIIEYNRIVCNGLYHSYGNKYVFDDVSEIYDKFKSPIAYSKFLSSKFHNVYEKLVFFWHIRNFKKESTTEYQKLINGLELSETTNLLLYDICTKKHCTLNLLNEIKQIDKEIGKVKVKVK